MEHFDVTIGKRFQAVKAGAVEIGWTEMAAFDAARREGRPFDLAAFRELNTTPLEGA